jgi:hypothetical protein
MLEPCWRSSLASFNMPPPRRRWRRPPTRHHLLPQAHGEAPQARSTSTRHPTASCCRWRFPKSWWDSPWRPSSSSPLSLHSHQAPWSSNGGFRHW